MEGSAGELTFKERNTKLVTARVRIIVFFMLQSKFEWWRNLGGFTTIRLLSIG
jgi:hypothetical protein